MSIITIILASAVLTISTAAVGSEAVGQAAVVTAPPTTEAAPAKPPAAKASADLDGAANLLATGLKSAGTEPLPHSDRIATLIKSAEAAIALLGADWSASLRLADAVALAKAPPDTSLEPLTTAIKTVEKDLRFRPTFEAPIPPNWPAFTPSGEVEVKSYPTYRAAFTVRKPMLLRQNRNFWTLFQHIQARNIPMTAPVEMPMEPDTDGQLQEASMAFLYPDATTGQLGKTDDGTVEVLDVPEMTVVGTAYRGKTNEARVQAAHERLQRWLKTNAATYEQAGPPRVLGWNSPSMPDARSYTEVQVPVKKKVK